MISLHETCQQYVVRRLSEGWMIVSQQGHHLVLSSPDGNILRPVDLRNDIKTLRPNAAGDETNINTQEPVEGEHWDKVDEAIADEDTTTVGNGFSDAGVWQRDLYNLPASGGSGTINFVKAYARCKKSVGGSYKIAIKSGGVVGETGGAALTASFVTYSNQWGIPPEGGSWTWAKIDALQAGVSLEAEGFGTAAICTQVYVEVDYEPAAGLENKSANMGSKMVGAGLI